MSHHFADRLIEAVRTKRAPVCVGFDPVAAQLPDEIRRKHDLSDVFACGEVSHHYVGGDARALAGAFLDFGRGVIDAVAALVPAIKINIAFFEPLYADGIHAYHNLVGYARDAGLLVIGDVKRADIGHTTAQYADAQLGSETPLAPDAPPLPDAVTVNPYFGLDGVKPFIDRARTLNRGLFVLVQTSNTSAAAVQGLRLEGGEWVSDRVAKLVQEWAGDPSLLGASGYSSVGAVVSPRDLESTRRLRSLMPSCLFLVPGFGAQGRTADEVAECFKADGTGAIVNASRSVIYAFSGSQADTSPSADWRTAIQEACKHFVEQVRNAVPTT